MKIESQDKEKIKELRQRLKWLEQAVDRPWLREKGVPPLTPSEKDDFRREIKLTLQELMVLENKYGLIQEAKEKARASLEKVFPHLYVRKRKPMQQQEFKCTEGSFKPLPKRKLIPMPA